MADPLSRDTTPEVEQIWLDGLRAKGPLWRLRRTVALTDFCWRAAERAFDRLHPGSTRRDRDAWLLRERYGAELATRVMEHCDRIGWHEH